LTKYFIPFISRNVINCFNKGTLKMYKVILSLFVVAGVTLSHAAEQPAGDGAPKAAPPMTAVALDAEILEDGKKKEAGAPPADAKAPTPAAEGTAGDKKDGKKDGKKKGTCVIF